jgi:hypothetical protein
MGWLMGRVIARLLPWGRRALTALLWRPWLSPAVAVVLLAAAGQLGVGWLIGACVAVGLVGVGALVGLAGLGRAARDVSPSGR